MDTYTPTLGGRRRKPDDESIRRGYRVWLARVLVDQIDAARRLTGEARAAWVREAIERRLRGGT